MLKTTRTRLDRFLARFPKINQRDVKLLLAQGRVNVDGMVATNVQQTVSHFSVVMLDNQTLQAHQPLYIMLHKPIGVVSATKDTQHPTAVSLLQNWTESERQSLHIAGRLDLNSSGLLLLTNDGHWSRKLSSPEHKVTKVYEVTLEKEVTDEMMIGFAKGIYFGYENATTRPAKLEKLGNIQARVYLQEGKYHQIKRMFGHFQNRVIQLHRTSIGHIQLDPILSPGESRLLTEQEIQLSPSQ